MKKWMIILFFTLITLSIRAEVYQIGEGTSSFNQAPVNGNNNYSWSKMIFTAAEIHAAGLSAASTLTGIGFYVHYPVSNCGFSNQFVFVRHTGATSYPAAGTVYPDDTGFSLVYSGDVTFQDAGWQQLSFTQPFTWDGDQGIEILWKNYLATSQGQDLRFRYSYTDPDYKLAYSGADGSFPESGVAPNNRRPNIQLVTAMAPSPAVAVYPVDGGCALGGSRLAWKSGGGCPTDYDVHFGTVNPPPLVNSGQTYTWHQPELEAGETYYWQIVPSNPYGTVSNQPVWNFRVPETGQLCESFEIWPPPDWSNPGSWNDSAAYPYHGNFCVYVSANETGNFLTMPLLHISEGNKLELMARSSDTSGIAQIRIKYSAGENDWEQLGQAAVVATGNAWQHFQFDLSSLSPHNYHLGIEAFNAGTGSNPLIWLDQVVGPRPAGLFPTPELCISREGDGFRLEWALLDGASGYRVYSAGEPASLGQDPPVQLGAGSSSIWVQGAGRRFFRITALY